MSSVPRALTASAARAIFAVKEAVVLGLTMCSNISDQTPFPASKPKRRWRFWRTTQAEAESDNQKGYTQEISVPSA